MYITGFEKSGLSIDIENGLYKSKADDFIAALKDKSAALGRALSDEEEANIRSQIRRGYDKLGDAFDHAIGTVKTLVGMQTNRDQLIVIISMLG